VTTKLLIYQDAILYLGERQLASLTENRESRRVLDAVWDAGLIDFVLEQGLWNFATRAVRIDYAPSITPPFGYRRAFDKPTDWILTAAVSLDEYFTDPFRQYVDEAGFWLADYDQLYIKYVSNDTSYGGDLSLWPRSFSNYVSAHMAHMASLRLSQSEEKRARLKEDAKSALSSARGKDGANEPPAPMPRGTWSRSRSGGGNGDRGNPGSLIG
jgi:hypothetical protein